MSAYTDGFVIIVPKKNWDDYQEMAELASEVWIEYGALDYQECLGDDLENDDCGASFTGSLAVAPDEVVVFAWISYESREHRDIVNAKVMKDPRIEGMSQPEQMPFDSKRMLYGGFQNFVSRSAADR
ncbi:MAG: DUF1428 domain-containing protein [Verrucomicrobiota bacterium JB023]|nr:DUF1428 domain-containing protein [Verrucomicrobiota bacterium JB023]